ncbi:MAG: chitobiase/beta-hexosaminidase C-terminal domain-containing protein, partial [Deltaproteobacteria bacterium]
MLKKGKMSLILGLMLPIMLVFAYPVEAQVAMNDQNSDMVIGLADIILIERSFNGGVCDLPPTVDLNSDLVVGLADVIIAQRNFNQAYPVPVWNPVSMFPPLEFSPVLGTTCNPNEHINIGVTVANKIVSQAIAESNCSGLGTNPISVDGLVIGLSFVGDPLASVLDSPSTAVVALAGAPNTGIVTIGLTCGPAPGAITVQASISLIYPDTQIPFSPAAPDWVTLTTMSFPVPVSIEGGTVCSVLDISDPTEGQCLNSSDVGGPTRQYDVVVVTSGCLDGSTVSLDVDGSPEGTCFTVGDTCTVLNANLNEGANVLTATAQGPGYVRNITVDTIEPNIQINSPVEGETICNTTVATSVTHDGVSCTEQLDGGPPQPCGTGFLGVAHGPHQIVAISTDVCGNSASDTVNFSVDVIGPVVAPTVAPPDGEYCVGTTLTVTTDEGGPAHCTVDGSVPDCASPAPPGTIDSDMTLRCIECDACNNQSPETARVYTVDVTGPLAPAIAPPDGEYCVGTTLTVTTAEGGPAHCTVDGSVPDCASPAPPGTIDADMTLRCVECD